MACANSAARRHVIYVKAANNKGNNSTEALLTDSGCLAHAMTPLIKTTTPPLDEVDPVQELNMSAAHQLKLTTNSRRQEVTVAGNFLTS